MSSPRVSIVMPVYNERGDDREMLGARAGRAARQGDRRRRRRLHRRHARPPRAADRDGARARLLARPQPRQGRRAAPRLRRGARRRRPHPGRRPRVRSRRLPGAAGADRARRGRRRVRLALPRRTAPRAALLALRRQPRCSRRSPTSSPTSTSPTWRPATRSSAGGAARHQAARGPLRLRAEITAKIARGAVRIYEVPISYAGRTYDEGKKITWKDGIRGVWCTVRYGLSSERLAVSNAVLAFLDDRSTAAPATGRPSSPPPARPRIASSSRSPPAPATRSARSGLEPEQRVAMLLPDGLEWAAVFLGALRIGAVAVPLNTRLAPADWAAMLRDSRARVLVADAALLADAAARCSPSCRTCARWSRRRRRHRLPRCWRRRPPECAPEPVSGDDMAFWLYTSGTTGRAEGGRPPASRPAGVPALRRRRAGRARSDRVLRDVQAVLRLRARQRAADPALRRRLHVPRRRLAGAGGRARVLRTFAPTLFFSVPTFYGRLLRADLPRDAFRSVRACVSAGERLPAELYEAWRERFGVEILDGLGATRDDLHGAGQPPGPEPRRARRARRCRGPRCACSTATGREVGGRRAGRPPPAHAVGEPGLLEPARPLAPRLRGRVVPHRRRDDARRRRLLPPLPAATTSSSRSPGMWVAPADVEAALLAHPRRGRRGRGRRAGRGRSRQAGRVRGGARPAPAAGAVWSRSWPRTWPSSCRRTSAAPHPDRGRAAPHGDRQAPALRAPRVGRAHAVTVDAHHRVAGALGRRGRGRHRVLSALLRVVRLSAARRSSPRWACRGPSSSRATASWACPSWSRARASPRRPATATR